MSGWDNQKIKKFSIERIRVCIQRVGSMKINWFNREASSTCTKWMRNIPRFGEKKYNLKTSAATTNPVGANKMHIYFTLFYMYKKDEFKYYLFFWQKKKLICTLTLSISSYLYTYIFVKISFRKRIKSLVKSYKSINLKIRKFQSHKNKQKRKKYTKGLKKTTILKLFTPTI